MSTPDVPIDYWRQLDLFNPHQFRTTRVNLIGCGGIGSATGLALGKMGVPQLVLWDMDSVENHNLPNQLYPVSALGQFKVVALRDEIKRQDPQTYVQAMAEEYDGQYLDGIVIAAVDSMKARQQIWHGVLNQDHAPRWLIDGRMGAETGIVYTCRIPEEIEYYQTTLHSDEAGVELPCTARAIIYNTFMLAALIANQVKRIAAGQPVTRGITFDFATLLCLTE